jgi:hypothetical protein
MKICTIDGCDSSVMATGLCSKHYQRNRKHGDPLVTARRDTRGMPLWKKFYTYVEAQSNGCWHWTGAYARGGYGHLCVGGKMVGAHRISWELHNNKKIGELLALHKCDNPKCVNPDHIFIGTAADNTLDMMKKGRSTKGLKKGQTLADKA